LYDLKVPAGNFFVARFINLHYPFPSACFQLSIHYIPGQVGKPALKLPTMHCVEAPARESLAFGGALGKPDHFGRLYTGKKILYKANKTMRLNIIFY
jgi:hypothetical protein